MKTRQWGFSCLLVFMFGTLSPRRAPGRDFVQNKRPQWAMLRGVCGKRGGRLSYRRRDLISREWLPGNHTERITETTTAAGGERTDGGRQQRNGGETLGFATVSWIGLFLTPIQIKILTAFKLISLLCAHFCKRPSSFLWFRPEKKEDIINFWMLSHCTLVGSTYTNTY